MKAQLTQEQVAAIQKALDEAIADEVWDSSNFLKVINKNLKEIRDNFNAHIVNSKHLNKAKFATHPQTSLELKEDELEVFVGLYATEGGNLQAWERVLANLPFQIISRPIYSNEEDITDAIKSKENRINEAYASVIINRNDILAIAQEKVSTDRFGKPLLVLKNKALRSENIRNFTHITGHYFYEKGRLIKNNTL